MGELVTLTLPHLPLHPLFLSLFTNLKNASFLRQQLLDGNQEFEYAFLDARMLLSENHVLAACFRALNDWQRGRLRSRNVHSEIVFSLSPNNNIAESFRRFGISDTTTDLLAIKVSTSSEFTAESVRTHLSQHVQADSVLFSDKAIRRGADLARIRKVYKAGGDSGKVNGAAGTDGDAALDGVEGFILGTMALKGS
ncbi:hypothetical protein LTR28_014055 [Elasticomyces elasticus]|nr:hypothetical protein LTR28_014055 [Elasticomyces elasticus]